MKLFISVLLLSLANMTQAMHRVYMFPGQGADSTLFQNIRLPEGFTPVYMELPTPDKGENLKDFATRFVADIDTSSMYSFIGVSLGGMVCSELAEILSPEHVILISSAKHSKELPKRYRFQQSVPLNQWIPSSFYQSGALFLQPIVEPDRNKYKAEFKAMLKSKDGVYLKRTVNLIINWDKQFSKANIVHIHGDNDHTIPIRNVSPDVIIPNGSHMMVLTRASEVNEKINEVLLG